MGFPSNSCVHTYHEIVNHNVQSFTEQASDCIKKVDLSVEDLECSVISLEITRLSPSIRS